MKAQRLFLGMVAGNAVAALLFVLGGWLFSISPTAILVVGLPSLLFVPFASGLTAAWVWKPLGLGVRAVLWHSFTCWLLSLLIGAVAFSEGAICLIILSPILYCGIAGGALLGRIWFRKHHDRLNICIIPLIFGAILVEPAFRKPQMSVVTDEIRIAAPVSNVWPHVLAFRAIAEPPQYWLFRLGLPYPVETTNGGNFVGAERTCRFSGGAVFKEVVAEIEPEHRLTFDIVEQPANPELIGHLDAQRGQFELRDNHDGTTILIGRTWYSLHVRPTWYFDWWTHDIFRAVHLRVMRNVKRLAENEP